MYRNIIASDCGCHFSTVTNVQREAGVTLSVEISVFYSTTYITKIIGRVEAQEQ